MKKVIASRSKLVEILEINEDPENDKKENYSLVYETTLVSNIKGAHEDNPIILESDDEDDVIKPKKKVFKGESSKSIKIEGVKHSYPPVFICKICVDSKPVHTKFTITACNHMYCSDCVTKYVSTKIEESITHITCPYTNCFGFLEPQSCREILPKKLFDKWGDLLCEDLITTTEKFYCPFKDCSALLINDRFNGEILIKECECPYCNRLFCVQCKVPWHSNIVCEDFQKLNKDEREKDDIDLMNLAKSKKWMRCPKCRFYVERTEGCLLMTCRCKFTFCYHCGAEMNGHYCNTCKH